MPGAEVASIRRSWMPWIVLLGVTLWSFRETASAMVSIWIRSGTFTHAFLVLPIVAWLVWRRRDQLAAMPVQPAPLLLLPMAAMCFIWLLGEVAAVGAASQFALVSIVVLSVPAVFGWAVARAVTFPLLFLYFSVPFGEFTVPTLMEWTADFTVKALQATGIPVYREGLQFVIPSGTWSVVEACSGVRYLIASFMVGTLFAHLNYRSNRRRLVFAAVSILVPVIANWMRAYLIVMIGHLSGNELAVGVDHLIYGWVFFGMVIGLMFFIGARWAEPEVEPVVHPAMAGPSGRGDFLRVGWRTAIAAAGMVAVTQFLGWRVTHLPEGPIPRVELPQDGAEAPGLPWQPGFQNPSVTVSRAYGSPSRPVWVWIGYYRGQGPDRKLVSSVNGLVATEDKQWSQIEAKHRAADQGLPAMRVGTLREGQAMGQPGATRLRVWHLYWVGGRWVTSDVAAKLWQAADMLMGRGDDGAAVLLVTPDSEHADADLEKFARDRIDALDAALGRARDTM